MALLFAVLAEGQVRQEVLSPVTMIWVALLTIAKKKKEMLVMVIVPPVEEVVSVMGVMGLALVAI